MMSDTRVKHIFLVGQSFNTTLNELIIQESKLYKDIIQGDFVDTYFNLTMKILMGLKWTHLYCYSTFHSPERLTFPSLFKFPIISPR
jgi:hypothetical protein